MSSALRRSLPDLTPPREASEPGDRVIGINEMARRFDTTYRTLRFYEAKGLLNPRRHGQNRLYDGQTQRRFKLISEGRRLGFTLSEIARLLSASLSKDALEMSLETMRSQIDHLEEQRMQIEAALADLRRRYYLIGEGDDGEAAA